MAQVVYILCAFTSALCAWMLFRNYRRNGVRLLMWGSACFAFLAIGNVMLFLDLIVVHGTDLSAWRVIPAVLGFAVMIYGFLGDVV